MVRGRNAQADYVKLEQRLVLLAWLNERFGFKSNRELLGELSHAGEGFDPSGRSYLSYHLEGRGSSVKIDAVALARYDENIRGHLDAMNALRAEPITLRYFQYLAVLYAEVYLDNYFNHRGELLRSLNSFVSRRNAARRAGEARDSKFGEADLKKLAFWMATGSGKTLIMHINYRQFLAYNDLPLDNILLITPNEGLSEQHIEEMELSGIRCRRFDLNESGLGILEEGVVRVIEITKLVEEKRGGGVSVPVEAFEGNNLIFVDEGHKGSGGEAWRGFREALGETGFTFEYSATFGQALTAARNDKLTAEYGKSIVFDYSYRYFHGDGYGKDFRILNLIEETTEDKTETLLMGNLLSFYEQRRVYDEFKEALREYNVERPLWVFVGSSVNAVYTEDKEKRSDVLTVARFLHHFLEKKRDMVKVIGAILAGKTGLHTPEGADIFESQFAFLRASSPSTEALYEDILKRVFHGLGGGGLHLCDMRGNPGELGLKVGGADRYFGLIYIGDTSSFKKLADADDSGIVLEEDAVTDSLFDGINEPLGSVEVLIGAKKFMEGWNSWRVSNMGLLNIGRKEGSEIIQLFGRGVRLRGKGSSLKRSSALDGEHPKHVNLLERLNIFGVRANYMAQFRGYLEKEGVETEGHVELPLDIRPNRDFLNRGLVAPRIPDDRNFADEADILLEPDADVRVHVDLSLKAEVFDSGQNGDGPVALRSGRERVIPKRSLELVDWEQAYLDLLTFKERKGLSNLAIRPGVLRDLIDPERQPALYSLVADDRMISPTCFADRTLLQESVTTILREYVEKFYAMRQKRWESERMVYGDVDENHPNFQRYTVKISRSETDLIEAVHALIEEGERIYEDESGLLPRIHFDRHLYQPLLVEKGSKILSTPPGLTEGERRFVEDLRAYCRLEKNGRLADKEVFLLRNLSKGKGIGFFTKSGFYPDFLLWVKQGTKQRIVFIEPHGMMHAKSPKHDDKAQLHETLRELTASIRARTGVENVELDSYIVSETPFAELQLRYEDGSWDMERFADAHILFRQRDDVYDYMARLFM